MTTISKSEGRLKYKTLIATPEVVEDAQVIINERPANRNKGVLQIKDGELIGHFKSVYFAAKETGISRANIRKVCEGKRQIAGGFLWIYA